MSTYDRIKEKLRAFPGIKPGSAIDKFLERGLGHLYAKIQLIKSTGREAHTVNEIELNRAVGREASALFGVPLFVHPPQLVASCRICGSTREFRSYAQTRRRLLRQSKTVNPVLPKIPARPVPESISDQSPLLKSTPPPEVRKPPSKVIPNSVLYDEASLEASERALRLQEE